MESKRMMYVGPTIVGAMTRNTTFEEMPRTLQDAIKIAPFLASLCIPAERLGDALTQITRKSGSVYNLYRKAQRESADIQNKLKGVT